MVGLKDGRGHDVTIINFGNDYLINGPAIDSDMSQDSVLTDGSGDDYSEDGFDNNLLVGSSGCDMYKDWTWTATDLSPDSTNADGALTLGITLTYRGDQGSPTLGDENLEYFLDEAYRQVWNADYTQILASEAPQNEIIDGGTGHDLLIGGAGADYIDGGADDDKVLSLDSTARPPGTKVPYTRCLRLASVVRAA